MRENCCLQFLYILGETLDIVLDFIKLVTDLIERGGHHVDVTTRRSDATLDGGELVIYSVFSSFPVSLS